MRALRAAPGAASVSPRTLRAAGRVLDGLRRSWPRHGSTASERRGTAGKESAHTGTTANSWLHRAEGREKRERRGREGERERGREGVRGRGREGEREKGREGERREGRGRG